MNKETTFEISKTSYKIKRTYKSMLLFEELTGKPISEMKKSLTDLLLFFYCIIKANNNIDFEFTHFIEQLDNEPEIVDKFNEFIINSNTTIKEEPVKKKRVNHLK